MGACGVMSLGGAHSNHLHALAAAGQRFGFATVGLLRGEPCQTPTVEDLQRFGMRLHWLGYGGYRRRHEDGFWSDWLALYPDFYPIAEGGKSLLGTQGLLSLETQVVQQLECIGWRDFDAWWVAAGTGTTMAGLALLPGRRAVYGAMAVPSGSGVAEQVAELIERSSLPAASYCVVEAARAGFARVDPHLLAFMQAAEQESGIALEPIYTAKALLALHDAVKGGRITSGTRLVFVHTGGLQGRRAALDRP